MAKSADAATERFVLFGGSANPALTAAIARELGTSPGRCHIGRFPDGEVEVRLDEPVRGREVFIVQPTSPSVNDHVMELLIVADACRRAAAERVTAVIPYFGYARSDKRHCRREPITASLVAELMRCTGIGHLMLLDIHAEQTEGFFRGPVDSLTAVPELCRALAGEYARRLGKPLVVLHKRRESGSKTVVTHVVGDVRGRPCLIIDDMISTGGTIAESVRVLAAAGAESEFVVAATHGVLLDGACDRMTGDAGMRTW
jgi:ribose-phosphate pyrophosphokinase